jgi:hypothetical protein
MDAGEIEVQNLGISILSSKKQSPPWKKPINPPTKRTSKLPFNLLEKHTENQWPFLLISQSDGLS